MLCSSRAAVKASWNSKVAFNRTATIPQQLWQTSRSKELGKRASMLHASWSSLNPDTQVTLMNDTEASAFISSFFGKAVAKLHKAYPLGVMRADFWRYAILYAYGGVYSDIDTQCLKPFGQWFPPQPRPPGSPVFVSNGTWPSLGTAQYHNLSWTDCSMVVGLENDVHMCQWTIASVPGHPVLQSTIHVALKSLEEGVRCDYAHMVHAHTGPGTWTEGVRNALGLPDHYTAADMALAVWTDPAVYQRARDMRLCIVAPEVFGGAAPAQNVKNHFSSLWKGEVPNVPWVIQKQRLDASLQRVPGSVANSSTP